VLVILVAQTLLQVSYSGSQPLITLKLIELMPRGNTAAVTGLAFAAAGVASAAAAVGYARLAARFGYKRVAATGALLAAGANLMLAFAPNPAVVVLAALFAGLLFGIVIPATSAMLGLEAPAAVQGTIFGFSASAVALGFGLGPLLGGTVAGLVNVPAALIVTAAVAAALAVVLAVGAREPAR
jgi:MFS family permease